MQNPKTRTTRTAQVIGATLAALLAAATTGGETLCPPVQERANQIDSDEAIRKAFIQSHIQDPVRFEAILQENQITASYFADLDALHEASGTRDSAVIFHGYLQDLLESGLLDGQALDVETPSGVVRVPDASAWFRNSILPGTQGLGERLLKVCQGARRTESALIQERGGEAGPAEPSDPETPQVQQASEDDDSGKMMGMMSTGMGVGIAIASAAYFIFPAAMPFQAAAEINNHGDFLLGIRQPLTENQSLLLYQDYENEFSGIRWETRW